MTNSTDEGAAVQLPPMSERGDILSSILSEHELDSRLTWIEEGGERVPFVILASWEDISVINDALNTELAPKLWALWRPRYEQHAVDYKAQPRYERGPTGGPFADMRRGRVGGQPGTACPGHPGATPMFLVPGGLVELDGFCESGFDDEWTECTECQRAVRTQPDGYGWQPDYVDLDGALVCKACCQEDPGEYIGSFHNDPDRMLNVDVADPAEHGWVKVDIRFERGMHPGQAADPTRISNLLKTRDIDHLYTGQPGQFDVTFWVWVPKDEPDPEIGLSSLEEATRILAEGQTDLDYDPGTEMAKALRGEPSDHYVVTERQLTPEEFISGDWTKR